jgi:hypothetical protein
MTDSPTLPTCVWCNLRRPEYTVVCPDTGKVIRVCRFCATAIERRHEDARKARGE